MMSSTDIAQGADIGRYVGMEWSNTRWNLFLDRPMPKKFSVRSFFFLKKRPGLRVW